MYKNVSGGNLENSLYRNEILWKLFGSGNK